MKVLHRYSNDFKSCTLLQANQKQFCDLIHGLINKHFRESSPLQRALYTKMFGWLAKISVPKLTSRVCSALC